VKFVALTICLLSSLAWAAPLSPTTRTVIPADARQVINIDYQMLRTFSTAMTLKGQVLPDNLREFENALKGIGVNPDSDLDSLTFASFEDETRAPRMVAIASGQFSSMTILTELRQRKLFPSKYRRYDLYPVSQALVIIVLDEDTLLLGDTVGVKSVLNIRDSRLPLIDSNEELIELMRPIEKATVWSVLDREATERMLLSALGNGPNLAGLPGVKEKLLGAYFRMNFRGGIRFDMDVVTSDTTSAAALKSLLKLGILYKKIIANPAQKVVLEQVSVASKRISRDSDRSDLKMQFKADDQQLQVLMQSACFTATSNERQEFSGFTSAFVADAPKEPERTTASPK
jgi:hypothetical protein